MSCIIYACLDHSFPEGEVTASNNHHAASNVREIGRVHVMKPANQLTNIQNDHHGQKPASLAAKAQQGDNVNSPMWHRKQTEIDLILTEKENHSPEQEFYLLDLTRRHGRCIIFFKFHMAQERKKGLCPIVRREHKYKFAILSKARELNITSWKLNSSSARTLLRWLTPTVTMITVLSIAWLGKKKNAPNNWLIGAEQENKSKSDILYPIKSWILRVVDTRNSLSAMTCWKKIDSITAIRVSLWANYVVVRSLRNLWNLWKQNTGVPEVDNGFLRVIRASSRPG